MGYAAVVISLQEARRAHAQAEARRQLHERFDRWLDAVEEEVPDKTPTLEDLTQEVFAMRQELTGVITETLVEQAYSEVLEQETMPCPRGGRLLHARDSVNRTVETMVGTVSLARPYFYCVRCEEGFYPLDEALQLAARRKQWDMQKAGANLATEVPYETASGLFCELTGLSLSDHIMHEVVGEFGPGLTVLEVSPTVEEMARRVAPLAQGRTWRPILVLAIDFVVSSVERRGRCSYPSRDSQRASAWP